MSTLVISESWSSCYLFPKEADFPIGKEVRVSMLKAADFGEMNNFFDSYILSTAFAIESLALSLFMTVGYIGKGIYDFFVILIDQGFFESCNSLGRNLLSSLQSLALSIIGVISVALGIFYPKTYSFLAPTEEMIIQPIELQDKSSQTTHHEISHISSKPQVAPPSNALSINTQDIPADRESFQGMSSPPIHSQGSEFFVPEVTTTAHKTSIESHRVVSEVLIQDVRATAENVVESELASINDPLQRSLVLENSIVVESEILIQDVRATAENVVESELASINDPLQRSLVLENSIVVESEILIQDVRATAQNVAENVIALFDQLAITSLSDQIHRQRIVKEKVIAAAREVTETALRTIIESELPSICDQLSIERQRAGSQILIQDIRATAENVVESELASINDPLQRSLVLENSIASADELLLSLSERNIEILGGSTSALDDPMGSQFSEDVFDMLSSGDFGTMSVMSEIDVEWFSPLELTEELLRPITPLSPGARHEIFSWMRAFANLFEEARVQGTLEKIFAIRTPLEDRASLLFQDSSLISFLNELNEIVLKKSGKEKIFIQSIATDLLLFASFVPSRIKGGQYEAIDPFSIKNVGTFLSHLIEGRDLGSTPFFNAYFENTKTAPQKYLFLSLLHLRFDIQQKVLEDPLFETLLQHPDLEEIMLSTSGHLIQTSLYSCVGAAYNIQILQKTPNIVALIYFIEYVTARSSKKLFHMTTEEKSEVAFENYHLTKEAHALEIIAKVEVGLEEMRNTLEKALSGAPFSTAPFHELTKKWNDLNQLAMSVLDPKYPIWFASLRIHGHYRTSYTLNVLGHLLSPWGPGFHERRSNGQYRRDLLDRIPVVDGVDGSSFDYDLTKYGSKEAKLEELQLRFNQLLQKGPTILLFQIAENTKHANIIRAFYFGKEPRFILFDPMKPTPFIMTFEEMLNFCDTHKMF